MAAAKWIEGYATATPDFIELPYTDLGLRRMTKAKEILRQLFPEVVNSENPMLPIEEMPFIEVVPLR